MLDLPDFKYKCTKGSCPRGNPTTSKRCKLEHRQEECYRKYERVNTRKMEKARSGSALKRTPIKQKAPKRSSNHAERVGLLRNAIFKRDKYTCQECGATDHHITMAHRIKQGEGTVKYIRKYAIMEFQLELTDDQIDLVINNPYNVVTACAGACNDSFNIFNDPVSRDSLLEKMLRSLDLVPSQKEEHKDKE